MQRARGEAIDIRQVPPRNCSEPHKVKVCVFRNERIEGPFDPADSAVEGTLPLEELQASADAAIPIFLQDGRHVGMEKRLPVTPAR